MSTKPLIAPWKVALIRYNKKGKKTKTNQLAPIRWPFDAAEKGSKGGRDVRGDVRFSFVCILLTCLFKCSLLAKHFEHPFTVQTYILPFAPPGGGVAAGAAGALPVVMAAAAGGTSIGTFLPRLRFVRFGTGSGGGTRVRRLPVVRRLGLMGSVGFDPVEEELEGG